jgi:imidazolonepropionase
MDPTVVVDQIDLLLTMDSTLGEGALGAIHEAAVAFDAAGEVCWIGPSDQAPDAATRIDGRGTVGLPGLVDCHTHSVWAGSRSDEWQRRLAGANYTDILEAGGGILSTVRATRAADEATLVALCAARLHRMAARGVGLVEVKSGYGLTPVDELRMLRTAAAAGVEAGVEVMRTFLGAHCVPVEHRPDTAAYVDEVIEVQLPLCAAEADFIDAYVDRGAFDVDQGRRILEAGKALGLSPRIHAEQVAFTGAAEMAAKLGALSADHLERIDRAGVDAMAAAGTIGVMLPGAMLYLKDPAPPVAALREAGVRLAVATDLNPGSSPVDDLWTCATLACVTMGLTVEEALCGITTVAADALGRPDHGRLRLGARSMVLARPRPGEPVQPAALLQHLGGPDVRVVRSA